MGADRAVSVSEAYNKGEIVNNGTFAQVKREMVLSKNVIKNGHSQPHSKTVLVDLGEVLGDISTPSLKLMAAHVVSIMERLQELQIDETRAMIEIKINQQMLKIMAMDLYKRGIK